MAALYIERYMNFGLTLAELHSGRPIIIAQPAATSRPAAAITSSWRRVRDGIRDAAAFHGVSRPPDPGDGQAADRGARPVAYLSLVSASAALPDGVVLTRLRQGLPAVIMAPARSHSGIVLSDRCDGHFAGGLTGSGVVGARQNWRQAIDLQKFLEMVASSAPSVVTATPWARRSR
jgi:dihydroxy-acid dehydratase